MPSNGYYTKNSTSDAMSEYHRDSAAHYSSNTVQGPYNKHGSWDGNKGRKEYYRFVDSRGGNSQRAAAHTDEKNKWYQVRDS